MADFGFTEEPQNIEALRVSDGSVELALQLVIDNAAAANDHDQQQPMDHQPS
jgi:hypothetical protein